MTSIVFPGQGSQFVGMSKDFYENFRISKEIFELISDTTQIDIKKIIFADSSNLLNQTKYTQLAIFSTSISIFNVLKNETKFQDLDFKFMLGHSLGEYTSLTAANYLSIEHCSFLLKKRGQIMQDAFEPNLSGMAAIIGLDCNSVEKIIIDNKIKLEVANDNSPMQIVISGKKEDLTKSQDLFKKNGAKKFLFLNVSAAFHSNIMLEAQKELNNFINKDNFNYSSTQIISNFSGKISTNNEKLIDNLKNQMSNKVRWVESIKTLEQTEEKNIIEIGPGKVLSGLIKRISEKFEIKNVNTVEDLKDL